MLESFSQSQLTFPSHSLEAHTNAWGWLEVVGGWGEVGWRAFSVCTWV